jgi:hypothetical protein
MGIIILGVNRANGKLCQAGEISNNRFLGFLHSGLHNARVDFGQVQLIKSAFTKSWKRVLVLITDRCADQ